MGAPLHALFAPAAGPQIGGGHLMRDLALAQALQAAGVACTFALPPWGERLMQRLAPGVARLHPLVRSGEPQAIAAAAQALRPDLLVLDDYALGACDTAALARPGMSVAVIDDLADRAYACELLVDPGFGRRPGDYAGRVPPGCEVLAGPRYALLRADFAAASGEAAPPLENGPVRRVFVSFGLSDVDAIAAQAVAVLRPRAPQARFDVALAGDAQSLPRLQAMAADDPGLVLHPDAREVAALMGSADVAVGAGGSATWERCALGLPTLAVVVADNQRAMIGAMAQAGVLLGVERTPADFEGRLGSAFERLCTPTVRHALRTASLSVCDGRGAARVAQALIGLASR